LNGRERFISTDDVTEIGALVLATARRRR
jgi:hypothetical protein